MLQQFAHALVEPLINQLLKSDASAASKLAQLNNKSFAVKLENLSIQVKLQVTNQQLQLSNHLEGADCLVSTTSDQLKQLSDAAQLTKLIRQDKLTMEGDLAIAQAFSALLLDNNIDWQQALAKYLGDGLAYRIIDKAQSLAQLFQNKSTDANYTVSALLTDELNVAPTEQEVRRFADSVDDVSAHVDRLSAELAQLRKS